MKRRLNTKLKSNIFTANKNVFSLLLILFFCLTACGSGEVLQSTKQPAITAMQVSQPTMAVQPTVPTETKTLATLRNLPSLVETIATTSSPTKSSTKEEETNASNGIKPLYRDPATFPTADPKARYVALTFDDGPHAENTPRLLNALAQHGVHVTFFVVGEQLQHPGNFAVAQRAVQEGHLLANHTWRHPDLTLLKPEEVRREIGDTDNLIRQITGDIAPFIRPPYGSFNQSVQAQVQRPLALWSIDPRDWEAGATTDSIIKSILQQLQARKPYGRGDIILLHDIHKRSVDAAIALLQILPQQGYTFVRLDDLLYMAGEQLNAGQAYFSLP